MTTWKEKLPRAIDWLGSDEWNYFVFPDILFVFLAKLFAFLLMFR